MAADERPMTPVTLEYSNGEPDLGPIPAWLRLVRFVLILGVILVLIVACALPLFLYVSYERWLHGP